jgi:hypothetical protein
MTAISRQEAIDRMLQRSAKAEATYISRELGKLESRKVGLDEAGGWAKVFLGHQWLAHWKLAIEDGLSAIKIGLRSVLQAHGYDDRFCKLAEPTPPPSALAAVDALRTIGQIKDRRYAVSAAFRLSWLIEHVKGMLDKDAATKHRHRMGKLWDASKDQAHPQLKRRQVLAMHSKLRKANGCLDKRERLKMADIEREVFNQTGVKPRTQREWWKNHRRKKIVGTP